MKCIRKGCKEECKGKNKLCKKHKKKKNRGRWVDAGLKDGSQEFYTHKELNEAKMNPASNLASSLLALVKMVVRNEIQGLTITRRVI